LPPDRPKARTKAQAKRTYRAAAKAHWKAKTARAKGDAPKSGQLHATHALNAPDRSPAVGSVTVLPAESPTQQPIPPSPRGNEPRRRNGRIIQTRVQARMSIAQAKFLSEFAMRGVVLHAAQAAGVSRWAVQEWNRNDPAFKAKYDLAREDAVDRLEFEARRRAEEGWQEEVYQMGEFAGYVRKYDGNLMALLLKGRRGDVFRERVSTEIDARVRAEANPLALSDKDLEDRILAEAEAIAQKRLTAGSAS
jgi:hypothetical protein